MENIRKEYQKFLKFYFENLTCIFGQIYPHIYSHIFKIKLHKIDDPDHYRSLDRSVNPIDPIQIDQP